MTDTKQIEGTSGTISVEEGLDDWGKVTLTVSSPKFNHKFSVNKTNDGFSFFEVGVTKGKVPSELSSRYTTAYLAKDAIVTYINKSRESPSVRRDKNYRENH